MTVPLVRYTPLRHAMLAWLAAGHGKWDLPGTSREVVAMVVEELAKGIRPPLVAYTHREDGARDEVTDHGRAVLRAWNAEHGVPAAAPDGPTNTPTFFDPLLTGQVREAAAEPQPAQVPRRRGWGWLGGRR